MEPTFTLRDYLDVVRRRILIIVFPMILLSAAAVGFAMQMPSVYEASAKILVEAQQIPTSLASPTVTASATERIQLIQQRLMSRENLLQIASKFGLYEGYGAGPSPTDLVELMRDATEIDEISVSKSGGAIGFTVTFRYGDAMMASRVANEFVASILSQNIQTRLNRAAETSKFFEEQLAASQRGLDLIEEKIAAFKRDNEDVLPETLPFRRAALTKAIEEMSQIRLDLAKLAKRNDVVRDAPLRRLEHSLDVKKLELSSREEERATLAPLVAKGFVAENRLREIDRAIASVNLEIAAIEEEIDAYEPPGGDPEQPEQLRSRLTELEERVREVRGGIARTPEIEAGLAALVRSHAVLQSQYQNAQARLAEAATGERLEEDRQSERFEVLEQATVPETPVGPKRNRIAIAGSLGGLILGTALAILMELMDGKIRRVSDIERKLQLRPIATIPYIFTRRELRARRLKAVSAATACLLVFGAAALVHFHYQPLDTVLARLPGLSGLLSGLL